MLSGDATAPCDTSNVPMPPSPLASLFAAAQTVLSSPEQQPACPPSRQGKYLLSRMDTAVDELAGRWNYPRPQRSSPDPAKRWRRASLQQTRQTRLKPLTLEAKLKILDIRAGYVAPPEPKVNDDTRRTHIENRLAAAWRARGAELVAAAVAARERERLSSAAPKAAVRGSCRPSIPPKVQG